MRTPTQKQALARGRLKEQVKTLLREALLREGVTKTQLARRLNVRKQCVDQALRGENMTLVRISDLFQALGYEVEIRTL